MEAGGDGFWSGLLIIILIFGALLFASAVGALVWAVRSGQMDNFEKGAKTIFTEEEPEGDRLDHFPPSRKERRQARG